MAYTRRTWVPEQTALSAENMNNIEDGIVEAKAAANGNETMWTYIRNKISSVLGLTAEQYNGNAATVNSHTVASDVPANALFTDTTVSVTDNGLTSSTTDNVTTISVNQKVIETTASELEAGRTRSITVSNSTLGIPAADLPSKWTVESVMWQTDTDIWQPITNDNITCSASIYGPNTTVATKNCVSIFLKNNTSGTRNVKVRVVIRNIGTTRV